MGSTESVPAARAHSSRSKTASVLMAGLEASGKTTVLCKLTSKKKASFRTAPTIGFNVKEIRCNGIHITLWDIGNESCMRNLRVRSLEANDALIFVVDTSDPNSLTKAISELWQLLETKAKLNNKQTSPVLILANKQDVAGAISVEELAEAIDFDHKLSKLCPCWHIQSTSALTGDGLSEGLAWLTPKIKDTFKKYKSQRRESALF